MPKQGKHAPWKVSNNYLADRKELKTASFEDGVLKFKSKSSGASQAKIGVLSIDIDKRST